jgi:uncharacterized membrane protein YgaE (UPF0421/DUF939 family)
MHAAELRSRIGSGGSRAAGRVAEDIWPLLQRTAAATVAWVIARFVFDHHEPFFAPVAAVVALNTSLGERGLNAVRLLQGVVVGIVVGEIAIALPTGTYGTMALAIFVAMAIARALGGTRIVVAQAAIGAILTVAVGEAEAGIDRLADAFIGAGVALVFSQVLFSPEPVRLLRGAEAAALADLADGLDLTGAALEGDDDELAERAMSRLRAVHDRLVELGRMRQASSRVARRSAVWRSRKAPVVRENENAGHLDLLAVSCLMLTRTAIRTSQSERRALAPSVRRLAAALADMGKAPGDHAIRQRAAEGALDVVRELTGGDEVAVKQQVGARPEEDGRGQREDEPHEPPHSTRCESWWISTTRLLATSRKSPTSKATAAISSRVPISMTCSPGEAGG